MSSIVARNRTELVRKIGYADGTLPKWADGGYPIIYWTGSNDALCPDCANGLNGSEATNPDCQDDREWSVQCAEVHYEGPAVACEHCGALIESAYGDPSSEEGEDSPTEDDIFTEDYITFWQYGKRVLAFPQDVEEEDVWDAIDEHCQRTGVYASVWVVEERGGYHLMSRQTETEG